MKSGAGFIFTTVLSRN